MSKALTPDELGAAGEALFSGLSARAKLFCNKSDRDRTGWDFVVEFPMPEAGDRVTLDERAPTACTVQLKSTAGAGPVSLRLSSAEHLAKDLRPAFIIVFRLTPQGDSVAGYLIHLLGPALRRVLHRLRTAHANKAFDVNHARISFDYRKFGNRFALTPAGLHEAMLEAAGQDRSAYVAEKQRQLDDLGYEDGGLEAEVLFWVESGDHLGDILLGLEPLRPERLLTFDTRFGIRVPYIGQAVEGVEELRIEPPEMGRCLVSIRGSGLSPSAVFDAEMFAGPPLDAPDGVWLLVRHDDFTLKFRSNAVAFGTTGDFDTTLRTLDAWIPLVRGLAYLASGEGVISLAPASVSDARISLPLTSRLDGPYLEQLPELARFLEGWAHLLSLAGTPASEPFALKDIWANRGAALAVDLFTGQPPRAWFAFDRDDIGDPPGAVEAIYINSCGLAGASISYSVKVTLERGEADASGYRSVRFQPLDVRPAVPDLQDYAEEVAEKHGLRVIINPANVSEIDVADPEAQDR